MQQRHRAPSVPPFEPTHSTHAPKQQVLSVGQDVHDSIAEERPLLYGLCHFASL